MDTIRFYELTMGSVRDHVEEARFLQSVLAGAPFVDLGCGPQSHLLWIGGEGCCRIGVDRDPGSLSALRATDPMIITYECEVFESGQLSSYLDGARSVLALFGIVHRAKEREDVRDLLTLIARVIRSGGRVALEVTDDQAYLKRYGLRGRSEIARRLRHDSETVVTLDWDTSERARECTFEFATSFDDGDEKTITVRRSLLRLDLEWILDSARSNGLKPVWEYSSCQGGRADRSEEPRRLLVLELEAS